MVCFNKFFISNINNTTSRSIALETHGKKMIWNSVKKERVYQFHVVYMTHQTLKKHRNHRYNYQKFESSFKAVTENSIKNKLTKNNVSTISLILFYDNRKKWYIKWLGRWFILSLMIKFVLIVFVWFNKSYTSMTVNFKRPSSMICLGWEYLRFCWISCHIMDLLNLQYRQLSWHAVIP